MKAVIINQYGGPEELQMATIERPSIDQDEVLVAVQATSINPIAVSYTHLTLPTIYSV